MTKKDNEDFKDSTRCRICDKDYVEGVFELRDHSDITGRYRGPPYIDCNINVKFNDDIPIALRNL